MVNIALQAAPITLLFVPYGVGLEFGLVWMLDITHQSQTPHQATNKKNRNMLLAV